MSLFSAQPELNQQPYSFLISILAHSTALGLLLFGILSAPKVKPTVIAERYAVRHLDLQVLDSEMEQAVNSAAKSLQPHSVKHLSPAARSAPAQESALRQVVQAPPGRQTLVQPDLPKPVTLPVEIPVPTVVIWNAANTPAKTIVAPVPAKPPVSDVKPSLQKPNQETKLAEIAIPAALQPVMNQPILPSTTSPVVLQGPKPTPPAPITTAAGSAQPTSATVMSLSSTRMANGPVTLPPVNESVQKSSPGTLAPAPAKDSVQTGRGDTASKGAGQAAGKAANSPDSAGAGQENKTGSGLGDRPSANHIVRPKTGQFGAVIVGSSLEDQFPETADLSGGKMAYTVYIPVGLPKNWPLEFWLARSGNSAADNSAHIEAPWPYDIRRPTLDFDTINADALIIHGFVNLAGRFEALTIAFPPEFAQAQYVLGLLNQWQFRPATQNGQDVKVEVLLIIPEETE